MFLFAHCFLGLTNRAGPPSLYSSTREIRDPATPRTQQSLTPGVRTMLDYHQIFTGWARRFWIEPKSELTILAERLSRARVRTSMHFYAEVRYERGPFRCCEAVVTEACSQMRRVHALTPAEVVALGRRACLRRVNSLRTQQSFFHIRHHVVLLRSRRYGQVSQGVGRPPQRRLVCLVMRRTGSSALTQGESAPPEQRRENVIDRLPRPPNVLVTGP